MSRVPAHISKRTIAIVASSLWLIVFGLVMVVYAISHIRIDLNPTQKDITRGSRVDMAMLFVFGVGGTLVVASLFSLMIDNARRIGRP
jgi:hypothetical protein